MSANSAEAGATIGVEVVYALPGRCWQVAVRLPEGADVALALREARLDEHVPGIDIDEGRLAVYGRPVSPRTRLADGDRVEVLRPLHMDPMQARRRRARSG